EILDPGAGEDRDVEGLAGLDLALERRGEAEGNHELVARVALERGRELLERGLHAVGSEHLDVGGVGRSGGEQGGDCSKRFEVHDVSPYSGTVAGLVGSETWITRYLT